MAEQTPIYVGTCGYRYYDAPDTYDSVLEAYSHAVDVRELNRTFYRLSRPSASGLDPEGEGRKPR